MEHGGTGRKKPAIIIIQILTVFIVLWFENGGCSSFAVEYAVHCPVLYDNNSLSMSFLSHSYGTQHCFATMCPRLSFR
eukprot:UN05771